MTDHDMRVLVVLYFLFLTICCIGFALLIFTDRQERQVRQIDVRWSLPTSIDQMHTPPHLEIHHAN